MHKDADSAYTESPSYFSYLGETKLDRLGSPRVKTSCSWGKQLSKVRGAVPELLLRLTIRVRYKTKYCKYLPCIVDADWTEAYNWIQARHQTGEMLDLRSEERRVGKECLL